MLTTEVHKGQTTKVMFMGIASQFGLGSKQHGDKEFQRESGWRITKRIIRCRLQCNNEILMHLYRTRHEPRVKEATKQQRKTLSPGTFERGRLVNVYALPSEGASALSCPQRLRTRRGASGTLKRFYLLGSTPSTDAGSSGRDFRTSSYRVHHYQKGLGVKQSSGNLPERSGKRFHPWSKQILISPVVFRLEERTSFLSGP